MAFLKLTPGDVIYKMYFARGPLFSRCDGGCWWAGRTQRDAGGTWGTRRGSGVAKGARAAREENVGGARKIHQDWQLSRIQILFIINYQRIKRGSLSPGRKKRQFKVSPSAAVCSVSDWTFTTSNCSAVCRCLLGSRRGTQMKVVEFSSSTFRNCWTWRERHACYCKPGAVKNL